MTKLVVCEACADIIAPDVMIGRTCKCGTHTAWYAEDRNTLLIYDKSKHECGEPDICGWKPSCFVIGIHNEMISTPISCGDHTYKEHLERILENTDEYYLFKQWNSCVIKLFPAFFGNDVKWSDDKIE